MNLKDRGGFLVVLISLLIGASEPMLDSDIKEKTAGIVGAEYRQALRILGACERPRLEWLDGEARERFALNCAQRLQGMAKLAIATGAADEARQALEAAKSIRSAVRGEDETGPEIKAGGRATIRMPIGETYHAVRVEMIPGGKA